MTRALAWVAEETWEACVDGARGLLGPDAEIGLLAVADAGVVAAGAGALAGLLGRGHPEHDAPLAALSREAAERLLAAAGERLGGDGPRELREGRVEHEVIAAAGANAVDVLVVARDGDRSRRGPRSLSPPTRFVVDHAPCDVLLVWPGAPPAAGPPAPPPRRPPRPRR
ncbi:MAG: hypothetical protein JWQ48_3835, partial [Conexibacter sp.]|nr:hypothetical protein [Conexibacter sp.]